MSHEKPVKKSGYVIDTNVLLVASGKANHVGDECVNNATKFLIGVKQSKSAIYLDLAGEILSEYRKKNKPFENRKPGNEFLRYLINSMGNPRLVSLVELEKDEAGNYVDFPSNPALRGFDEDDKKFVAVAIASKADPEIADAADSDWKNFEKNLQRQVKLKFLCK